MTHTLNDGVYRIKTKDGEFATTMAVQVRAGKGRPMHVTTSGDWGYAREAFGPLTDEQVTLLAAYGLHDNQALAHHSR